MQVKRETAPMTKVDNKLDIILEYEARLHQEYEQQKFISYFAKQWVNNTIEKCKEEISVINKIILHNDIAVRNVPHDLCKNPLLRNRAFYTQDKGVMEECLIVAERMLEYIEEREK